MAAITNYDALADAFANGRSARSPFTKQFNPTAAAAANQWHSMARGGGMPQADAIFDAGGTNLLMRPVYDITPNSGALWHGGDVGATGADVKNLISAFGVTAAATVVPCTLVILDIVGFFRVTTVTTTTAQTVISTNTFTADAGTDLITYANDWDNLSPFQFTTTGTLPAPFALNTTYWIVRQSATTARVAPTFVDAKNSTGLIDITTAGTGTHTMNFRWPRYTNGNDVDAVIFNPSATALGAGTPGMQLGYTNSAGTAGRLTPSSPSLPIANAAATASQVIYSGATGAGKFGPFMPRQGADGGVRTVQTILNNATMTSGQYCVAFARYLGEIPLQVLGQGQFVDFTQATKPSWPQVPDGAALYFFLKSTVATPANSAFDGNLVFAWAP